MRIESVARSGFSPTPNFSLTYGEQDFSCNSNHEHKRNGNGTALLEGAEDISSLMKTDQENFEHNK
jgi:hypothetical protein